MVFKRRQIREKWTLSAALGLSRTFGMTPQDEDPHILVKSDRVYGRGQVGYQVLAQRILGKENHFHKDKKGKVPVQILGKNAANRGKCSRKTARIVKKKLSD